MVDLIRNTHFFPLFFFQLASDDDADDGDVYPGDVNDDHYHFLKSCQYTVIGESSFPTTGVLLSPQNYERNL